MPSTSASVSGRASAASTPAQPFCTPTTSWPRPTPTLTMLRIAAFMPGESPPEVSTPMRM